MQYDEFILEVKDPLTRHVGPAEDLQRGMVIYTAEVPFGHGGQQADIVIRDDRGIPAVELTPPESVDNAERAESVLQDAGWRPTGAGSATELGWAFPVARDPDTHPPAPGREYF